MSNDPRDKIKLVDRVASVVLAGGQGTRLFPLTEARCKPAVSFGGRYRLIDIPVSNSLNSAIRRIYVISQYLASNLHQHILSTYHLDPFQTGAIELLSPEEAPHRKTWFKGTADAVRQNLDHLLKAPVDYFLILSGDQLYNMDLEKMVQFAEELDVDLVIAALPVEESEAKRMGLLKTDSSGLIIEFYEKPTEKEILDKFELPVEFVKKHPLKDSTKTHYLGSMGIYVFRRQALVAILREQGDDFGKEIIPKMVKKGRSAAYVYNGYWEDIGTVHSYYEANMALLSSTKNCLDTYDEAHPIYAYPCQLPSPMIRDTLIHNSIISEGAIIEAKEISHSVVGLRAHVKKGTIIRDSVIMGHNSYAPELHQHPPLPSHFCIGENCIIQKAIIDENTMIGNNVQLINKDKIDKLDGDGIYIRDGIIIVPSGARLPDGFIL